ncbi:DMT family transporter [Bordetella genomosp. 13]|uniref:DMT family transporter n=1 Tax=Bordetella genomosp. 13 TaxID=463040 RepID=UPI0011A64EEB|nr:DMT family transporter [Bordetella genomosp. 13]
MSGAQPAAAATPRAAVPSTRPLAGIALLVLSLFTLSCLDGTGKWVMAAGVPMLILSWVRYAVHLLLVLALLVPQRGWKVVRSVGPREQMMRGGAMLCATLMFFNTLHYIPQAEATAINFLAPLIVLASAPWVLREPPRLSRWAAAGIAFLGVLIVIRPGGGLPVAGIISGLLTAICFAAQYIFTRRVARDDPYTSLVWSGAVGTVVLTLAMPIALPPAIPMLQALDGWTWMALLSTGVTGALGHLLQIGAYRNAPASILAPFTYLQIISATTVGWLMWGHFPDSFTWVGIAVICTSGMGIGALEWRRARRASIHQAAR